MKYSFFSGSATSLFGYKLTTPEAVAEVVKLRTKVFSEVRATKTLFSEEKQTI